MNVWYVITNCGWQLIVGSVVLVQFLTILWLRRRVHDLSQYEYWYYSQPAKPQPSPRSEPLVQTRFVRRPRRRW